jgi:predicted AAA+ superfamily ATPase
MYSINSLTGLLKSLGYGVPKSSVAEYISWFEDAYFLFTVRLYDASYRRSNANTKKIYCIDHALVRSVTSGILANSGHILENIVFLAIRRICAEIWYYRTAGNREVDFVYRNKAGEPVLVQVCESIAQSATRNREIAALQAAMQELRTMKGFIITRNETEQISTAHGIIEVMPAWKFLLESWD